MNKDLQWLHDEIIKEAVENYYYEGEFSVEIEYENQIIVIYFLTEFTYIQSDGDGYYTEQYNEHVHTRFTILDIICDGIEIDYNYIEEKLNSLTA